jgi:S-formylglutathione hydrolase FrmB
MAHARIDLFSDVLGLSTSITVLLPQRTTRQIGLSGAVTDGTPVLYLLHGLSDDDTTWTRRTSLERYVADLGLAVVMPAAHRSFYTDEVHGLPFWTYLTVELPELVRGMLRLDPAPEETFVAGLSMGGYGALKWALREPHRFGAAASLSGALGLGDGALTSDWAPTFRRVFGDRITGTDDDVLHLAGEVDPAACPPLYVACGSSDDLVEQSRAFLRVAEGRGLPVTAVLDDGGHDWAYWDARIQDVLAWLPLR